MLYINSSLITIKGGILHGTTFDDIGAVRKLVELLEEDENLIIEKYYMDYNVYIIGGSVEIWWLISGVH